MTRSGQGALVVARDSVIFGRRVRDATGVHAAVFTDRLARQMAATAGDGHHSGWTVTPATRKAV